MWLPLNPLAYVPDSLQFGSPRFSALCTPWDLRKLATLSFSLRPLQEQSVGMSLASPSRA